jgi:hypothetical protein
MKRETEIKLLKLVLYLPVFVVIGVLLAFGGWYLILILGGFVGYLKWINHVDRLPFEYRQVHPVKYRIQFMLMLVPILIMLTIALSWALGSIGIIPVLLTILGLVGCAGLVVCWAELMTRLERLKNERKNIGE